MQFLFTVDITMGGLCSKNNDALDKSGSSVKKIEDPGLTTHSNFVISEEPATDSSIMKSIVPDLPPSAPYTEPSTGVVYKAVLENNKSLVGTGVRTKFRVKVYVVGVYVSKQDYLQDAEAKLNDPSTPCTLIITLVRSLTSSKMISGLTSAILPLMASDKDKCKEFEGFNPKEHNFEAGAVMRFDVKENVCTYTHPNGKVHALASREFCKALKGIYFGSNGVIGGLKDEVCEGIGKD